MVRNAKADLFCLLALEAGRSGKAGSRRGGEGLLTSESARGGLSVGWDGGAGYRGEVLDDLLGVFGFSSSGFARNEDTLTFPLLPDLLPCPLSDCKDVGRVLLFSFGPVLGDDSGGVDGEGAIRVEGDQEEPR